MPNEAPQTESQQAPRRRVRTGCLTCRSRRRKCDETKPKCRRCSEKGLSCRYGIQVTFLKSNASGLSSSEAKSLNGTPGYKRIKFVDDSDAENDTTEIFEPSPAETPKTNAESPSHAINLPSISHIINREDYVASPGVFRGDVDLTNDESITVERVSPIYQSNDFAAIVETSADAPRVTISPEALGTPANAGRYEVIQEWTHPPVSERNAIQYALSSQDIIPYQIGGASTPSRDTVQATTGSLAKEELEINLLQFYRYNVAPWLDLGDLEQTLGMEILQVFKQSATVQQAILKVSARKQLLSIDSDTEALNSMQVMSQDGWTREEMAPPFDIPEFFAHWLRALTDFISSSPCEWRKVVVENMNVLRGLNMQYLDSKISRAMYWLWSRMDLASAIISSRQPILQLEDPDQAFDFHRSLENYFRRSIFLLHCSLSISFNNKEDAADHDADVGSNFISSLKSLPVLERWKVVWLETQRWFTQRPPELQPVLNFQGPGTDSEAILDDCSFPLILFTTPLALMANIAHHVSCLTLLSHKPRLVKPSTDRTSSVSAVWHAQHIAGIATNNVFSEALDPLLLASLLVAAKRMSHGSQQMTMIETLSRIHQLSGLHVDSEIEFLKDEWNLSQQD
ncbi:hypothetical protein F5884DRAFT_892828 [Xylogone sp. PMI_703]|nr:hypothetical protein F5884DRAFT_892828 [Xylogone sp. PMI_703]